MKKKIISGILSVLILCSTGMPIANTLTVFADEAAYEYNDGIAGIEFKSFDDMADLVNSLDEKLTDVEPEVAEYLLETDGIYLPEGYNEDDIFKITVDPTRVWVGVLNDTEHFVLSKYFKLCYYHDTEAGKSQYDYYKNYQEKLNNGTTDIYKQEFAIMNSYVWESDGKYFMLDDYTKSEDTIYTLCTAHKILFDKDKAEGEIKTASDLLNMKSDGDYYLANDIDLSGVNWKPIKGFSGSFDGNGYEIKGLNSKTYGLFSSLKSGAKIQNVKMTGVYIASKYGSVGAIAGGIGKNEKNIIITNCYVDGVVASCRTKYGNGGKSSVAGSVVGTNSSKSTVISNCYSNAVVCAEATLGGIAGINKGTIKNCGFGGQTGNSHNNELAYDENGMKNDDYWYSYAVGGIAGINYGTVESCFSNCTRLEIGKYYGGIVGIQNGGKITKCVNSSDVLIDDEMTGGLIVGYASKSSVINNCYTKYPDSNTVSNDVGKGKTKTVTYAVKSAKYGKISSFKRLGSTWCIYNKKPVIKSLKDYVKISPQYVIEGENIIDTYEEEASVDYGYDENGDILE